MMSRLLPSSCNLCPRACGADRTGGVRGRCGADNTLRVARAALHMWEEPPISGTAGSGAVFFANCPLHCIYCQNYEISAGRSGKPITASRLAAIFLELQEAGALNINLVTPTHYHLQIMDAIDDARRKGLRLPIVYNTGGYETVESIKTLEGYVDIYLTDFKYASPKLAAKYSNAPDYPELAAAALAEMVSQVGPYTLLAQDETGVNTATAAGDSVGPGLLRRGVIVRHLMLPGQLEDSKAVVRQVYEAHGDTVCLSLMNQYTPLMQSKAFPELQRMVEEGEYSALIDYALALGVTNSFMQEGGTAEESFIPPFDNEGV